MPNKSKQKGYRLEHFLEKFLNEQGIKVKRRAQANQEDLFFEDLKWNAECKHRKSGLKSLYDWLGDKNVALFLKWSSRKARNKPILVVMELREWVELVKAFKERMDRFIQQRSS